MHGLWTIVAEAAGWLDHWSEFGGFVVLGVLAVGAVIGSACCIAIVKFLKSRARRESVN